MSPRSIHEWSDITTGALLQLKGGHRFRVFLGFIDGELWGYFPDMGIAHLSTTPNTYELVLDTDTLGVGDD